MSNVALRVGRFVSWQTLDEALPRRRPAASACRSGVPAASGSSSWRRDELAFFGLCMEVNHDDPRAEMDRLSLVSPEAEIWEKTPLFLL